MPDADERQAWFDRLYAGADDPYGVRTRWYEARKRAILLAALPRPRFARAFEPACGIGELTRELAPRCGRLLASDASARALQIAAERNRGLGHVQFERQLLPRDWPQAGPGFDLIVVSEVGYFLDAEAMAQLARCCGASLGAQGTLVACDWRPDFAGRTLSAERIHGLLAGLGLPRIARYEDEDFLLTVWDRGAASVAERDGIRPRRTC